MSGNDWTTDRLTRAGLGALLKFGAKEVLGLVARLGPQEAWQVLRADQAVIQHELDVGAPVQPRPPGTRGEAFAAWVESVDPEAVAQQTDGAGLRFIVPGDNEWPGQLDDLEYCDVGGNGGLPVGLWVAGPGHLADWCGQAVAMVGSRAATRYGEKVAFDLAAELAAPTSSRWVVVSGGAFGIDAASHRGALMAGGRTIGVFANGIDGYYPPANTELIRMIKGQGLLVSEMPPGCNPTRKGFLARNRLIAALSSGTVVVEAGARSGAANTASWAGALNRVVMAVPGPITSAVSVTPHRLIRDGQATLVAGADDVRALLAPFGQSPELPYGGPARRGDELNADQSAVREALPTRVGLTVNEVALMSGVPVQRCIDSLQRLRDRGYVAAGENGRWRALPGQLAEI